MSELTVLQAVRLKGRVSEADLGATLGEDPADVAATLAQLTATGLLLEDKTLRISPEGRGRLNALLAQERSGIDQNAL
ncbi:MAG TPA: MarR family transcriptional regulator, partial [Mycobacterium sp.]